jgi:hypothetical protein
MFELLTEIAPGLKRVAMLFNPDTAPGGGPITSAISSLRSDRPTWTRSQRAPVAMQNLAWKRARRRTRCHARLLYAESYWANHIDRGP